MLLFLILLQRVAAADGLDDGAEYCPPPPPACLPSNLITHTSPCTVTDLTTCNNTPDLDLQP